ncbi:MAG TPA: 2-oxo-4-hydroxy-4-carboxy-5-ureidoimidazoline decarboxylase [Stellaceae bacterium]|nr:2-oxo-4-hydroxy-4-carboxy-5-ureidoimidazoline decarboxylase [Stellaceae bacterium]
MPPPFALDALNSASTADFVAAMAHVFEHSPWVVEAATASRPFETLAALRDAMLAVIEGATPEQRLALIRAHPDLADRVKRATGMTPASAAEQDGAGLHRLSESEFEQFEKLNDAYREKFGFPFILGVRRHTKDSILDRFARRLDNAVPEEEAEALAEIGRIASLRLAALVEGGDALAVHGQLSTHVLDKHAGLPADGVSLELVELSREGESRVLVRTVTNADGRTDAPLIADRPVPIGAYELRFHAGAYYARRGVPLSDPRFLDIIAVRFGVAEPEAHLHVTLLMTPWGYTTYRGS